MKKITLRKTALAVTLAAALAPAAASYGADGTSSIGISLVVPLVCRVDFTAASPGAASEAIPLGRIDEFCNSGGGYRVIADYAPASDPGRLVVDGRPVELEPDGSAVIAVSPGPSRRSRMIAYLPGSTPLSSVQVRVEAS